MQTKKSVACPIGYCHTCEVCHTCKASGRTNHLETAGKTVFRATEFSRKCTEMKREQRVSYSKCPVTRQTNQRPETNKGQETAALNRRCDETTVDSGGQPDADAARTSRLRHKPPAAGTGWSRDQTGQAAAHPARLMDWSSRDRGPRATVDRVPLPIPRRPAALASANRPPIVVYVSRILDGHQQRHGLNGTSPKPAPTADHPPRRAATKGKHQTRPAIDRSHS